MLLARASTRWQEIRASRVRRNIPLWKLNCGESDISIASWYEEKTGRGTANQSDSVQWIDPVFVRAKQDGQRTFFFLCIAERGGNSRGGDHSGKQIEYSVCLGDTLELPAEEWLEVLRKSPTFRSVSFKEVLKVVEKYATAHGFRPNTLAGLREAARGTKRARPSASSERRSQGDERIAALRLLGLPPGASDHAIELAFRKAARRHHPDAGGDPAKFRSIVNARDFLLGRDPRPGELA